MKSAADYYPTLWGRSGWKFIHHVALGYSNKPRDEDVEHYKSFMMNLGYVLPCKDCRENFNKQIKKLPVDEYLKNSHRLFEWVILVQNEVNKTLNKPLIDVKYLHKYYVNENRRIALKDCCGLQGASEKISKKIFIKE